VPRSSPAPGHSNAGWHLTPLDTAHARGVAECHIASWRESYRGIVPDPVLGAFDLDECETGWRRMLDAGCPVHVALTDDEVIGFACARAARDPEPPAPTELHAMYVRGAYHGSGVADALIDAAIGPAAACSLWVFDRYPRAIAFYRKHGFTPDGARRPEPFGAQIWEVRMLRH
jgi:2-(1,2-epoxy-1,2-dihydrophenyl)acetyl-CoA isomerase